ncbi:hypothetical protein BLNAU_4110 [Blattamonas nauphoetae]|uniref:RRM domain-containing protein n=1 Tax=Blattamonas nauphoetae TaxID=2049346 RepID=A0ABQ9YB72_9EUKA|nr:hypothetical protein BLNAU_4110 [Blattamonas nauphoetae]
MLDWLSIPGPVPTRSSSVNTSTPRSLTDAPNCDQQIQQPNVVSPPISEKPWLTCVTLKNIPTNVTFEKISRLLSHLGTVSAVYLLSQQMSNTMLSPQSPAIPYQPPCQWKASASTDICTAVVSFVDSTITENVNITSKCLHIKRRKVLLYHTNESTYLAAIHDPATTLLLPPPQTRPSSVPSFSPIIQQKDALSLVLDGIPRFETLLSVLSHFPSFSITSIKILPNTERQCDFQSCILEFPSKNELERCHRHVTRFPPYPTVAVINPPIPAFNLDLVPSPPRLSFFPTLGPLSQSQYSSSIFPRFSSADSLELPFDGLRSQFELALTPLHLSSGLNSSLSGSYFQTSPDPYFSLSLW